MRYIKHFFSHFKNKNSSNQFNVQIRWKSNVIYTSRLLTHKYVRCITILYRLAQTESRKTQGYEEFLHTRILHQYHNDFFKCLSHFTGFFFSNYIYWCFNMLTVSLFFLQQQWKNCILNFTRRQLAWVIYIRVDLLVPLWQARLYLI